MCARTKTSKAHVLIVTSHPPRMHAHPHTRKVEGILGWVLQTSSGVSGRLEFVRCYELFVHQNIMNENINWKYLKKSLEISSLVLILIVEIFAQFHTEGRKRAKNCYQNYARIILLKKNH